MSAGEDDGIASASDIEAEANVANVERMRAESDKRKRKRRGSQTTPRARGKSLTSPWTTTAASVSQNIDGSWAATCRLCQASLKLGKTASSTNVKNHWASQHAGVYRRWELASENDKLKVLQDALAVARSQVSQLDVFARQARRSSVQSNAKLVRRVCGVFMIASSQSPWALLDSPGVETYVRVCGGTAVDQSKHPCLTALPDVYEQCAKVLAAETGRGDVGSITYDGWSARLGAPIAGVTFNFVDDLWELRCMPICFFDTQTADKNADGHTEILRAVTRNNDKLSSETLIFSGTTDNEPAVALGMDQFLDFNGGLRCVAHSLSLAVNTACDNCPLLCAILQRVNEISTYVNQHTSVNSALVRRQSQMYGADRVTRLSKEIFTRWHSKLTVMDKYNQLHDDLSVVLQNTDAHALLLDGAQLTVMGDFMVVLTEVRRVSRALEADRRVSGARAPRLLRELMDTMELFAADGRNERARILSALTNQQRPSCASLDQDLNAARTRTLATKEAGDLAASLKRNIQTRLGHLFAELTQSALQNVAAMNDDDKKRMRSQKQALLLQCAAVFDVNECGLDWLESHVDRNQYAELLLDAIMIELREIYAGSQAHDFAEPSSIRRDLKQMRAVMLNDLQSNGRRQPNQSLQYWRRIANSSYNEMERNGTLSTRRFAKAARAYLSLQATSASAERLFGVAGYQEGSRRTSSSTDHTEMLLLIRALIQARLDAGTVAPQVDDSFMAASRESKIIYTLAKQVAAMIES